MGENKVIKYIGLALLIVVFAVGGFFLGKRTAETENLTNLNIQKEEKPAENTPTEITGDTTLPTGIYEAYYAEDKDNNEKLYHRLTLRDDGTFFLYVADLGNGSRIAGTYTVENGKLVLKETARYGSDACFYTNDLTTHEGTINNETITMKLNVMDVNNIEKMKNMEFSFTKTDKTEEDDARAYNSAYPKDGVTPAGSGEAWIDCTNLSTK